VHAELGFADRLVLVGFFAAIVGLAIRRGQRHRGDDAASYLAAGRTLTLPAFVANLVATWYGGVLGVGEYSYRYGVANWLVFGVPYYAAAAAFALWVAPRARRSRALTIPEQLRAAYGDRVAAFGAALVFGVTLPGAYLLMAGTIAAEGLGVPLPLAIAGIVVVSLSYLLYGGMRAIVAADRFYIVLMYGGFMLLVGYLLVQTGGIGFLRERLDPVLFSWNGGQAAQAILVWYVIALATLVEPAFYEACFAARDPQTARRGIFISIAFWAFFDCMTTTSGLYARALMPDLPDTTRAFPLLGAQILPPILAGLFFAGMLATVLSTFDSYLFISAQTLGHDLLARWRHADAVRSNMWTRIGLAIAAAGAVGLAMSGLSVIEVWHHLGSIGTPALLVPMLASFDARLRVGPRAAGIGMVTAAATAAVWIATARDDRYWLGVEPIFPALAVALAVWGVGRAQLRRVPQAAVAMPTERPAPQPDRSDAV
jgi:SSS family solute:Na+ symporter